MDIGEKIKQLAQENFEEIRACRRHIHQHPELSFQEFETAKFIQQKLTEYGIPFTANIAKTGIVAIVEGKNPSSKTIALRADMDALPILEQNNNEYTSQNKGVMHACGHDAHTACLLGAGKILQTLKNEFEGSVKLIFQPSEEKLPGGASEMIKAGVLENPQVEGIIGQHVFTPFKVGTVAFCFGNMMASTDEIYITIKGKGGHGAYPQDTKDPVMMAAQMLVAMQQVVSRTVSPFQPAVLTFGKVIANGATNIIPDEVYLEGTFRAMDETVRSAAHQQIKEIAKNTVAAFGGTVDVNIAIGYPVLTNNDALTQRSYDRAVAYLGKENVIITTPRMGAEDFAFYSQKVPACFYRLGSGNPDKGITSNIHTPTFNIDENALVTGMGLMAFHALGELSA
ncbi:MAG: amidohydrolase [Bacteroidetes bacterium]|nr:amidohydrolase [Bacteroidota bacterium]